jgi:hypothetical protein
MKLILRLTERVDFVFRGLRLAILKLLGVPGDPRKNEHSKAGAS